MLAHSGVDHSMREELPRMRALELPRDTHEQVFPPARRDELRADW